MLVYVGYISPALTSDINIGTVLSVTVPGAQADFVQALVLFMGDSKSQRAGAESSLHLQAIRRPQEHTWRQGGREERE